VRCNIAEDWYMFDPTRVDKRKRETECTLNVRSIGAYRSRLSLFDDEEVKVGHSLVLKDIGFNT
jgi:hypothetical protein